MPGCMRPAASSANLLLKVCGFSDPGIFTGRQAYAIEAEAALLLYFFRGLSGRLAQTPGLWGLPGRGGALSCPVNRESTLCLERLD